MNEEHRQVRDQPEATRFVSQLTRDTVALVLAGGRGTRLKQFADWRCKPAVPFGGKFRIIDFTLSNCVNSGIRRFHVTENGITLITPAMLGQHLYTVR